MQSWGTDLHFEVRKTDRYPSKSAVIGMIAAGLGYRRDEDEKIEKLRALDFALRIDQPGEILRDFHIATKYKDNGDTERLYVTNRYYLQDAVFVAAIGSCDNELMDAVEQAVKSPHFQPFMGRRSLPVGADFFLGTTDKEVVESLREIPWQASAWYRRRLKNSKKLSLDLVADAKLAQGTRQVMTRDIPLSFSYEKRQHGFRPVSMLMTEISLEHDAMSALGG